MPTKITPISGVRLRAKADFPTPAPPPEPPPSKFDPWLGRLIAAVEKPRTAIRATAYLSPTLTIKATRQHPGTTRERTTTVLLTFGRPNWTERQFIKNAKASGRSFPIPELQLKLYRPRK